MSSIEDRLRELESRLPEDAKQRIQLVLDQISELMDQVIKHEERIDELIKFLIRVCDEIGLPPDLASAYIKHKLKGIVDDRTIERHLPTERKRKYERYQQVEIRHVSDIDHKKDIEVSTVGSESYTKPDGSEGERPPADNEETPFELYEGDPEPIPSMGEVQEQAAEIAISLVDEYAEKAKEYETRLNEALALADDKDKRIYQLQMQAGELEVQIADLKKNPPPPKDVDKNEELQIENDRMKETILELQEALRAQVKASGFVQSSQLPKHVWTPAIDAMNLFVTLQKARAYAIDHNDPWHKIVFDIATDGRVKGAKLESEPE